MTTEAKQLVIWEYIDQETMSLNLPATMQQEEWAAAAPQLGLFDRTARWWVGDWLNFGELNFGEEYAQAASETGLHEETLKVYQWVASRVPRENRRTSLGWEHHKAVAKLEPDDQARWLDQAEANSWGATELRKAIKGEKGDDNPGSRDPTHYYECPRCHASLLLGEAGLVPDPEGGGE